MKKLIFGLIIFGSSLVAIADDGIQYIANPWNTTQVMALTQENCPSNRNLGVARVDGAAVGCWGINDEDKSVWLVIRGKSYRFGEDELRRNAQSYNNRTELPLSTILAIQNAYKTPPVQYAAPTYTPFYGIDGAYRGYSYGY